MLAHQQSNAYPPNNSIQSETSIYDPSHQPDDNPFAFQPINTPLPEPIAWSWPTTLSPGYTVLPPQSIQYTTDYSISPTSNAIPRYSPTINPQHTAPSNVLVSYSDEPQLDSTQHSEPSYAIDTTSQYPSQPSSIQTVIYNPHWDLNPPPVDYTQHTTLFQPIPTHLQTYQPLLSTSTFSSPSLTPPTTSYNNCLNHDQQLHTHPHTFPQEIKTPRQPILPLPPLPTLPQTSSRPSTLNNNLNPSPKYGPDYLSISQRLDLIDSPPVITRLDTLQPKPLPPPPVVLGWVPPDERPIPPRIIDWGAGEVGWPMGYLQGVNESVGEQLGGMVANVDMGVSEGMAVSMDVEMGKSGIMGQFDPDDILYEVGDQFEGGVVGAGRGYKYDELGLPIIPLDAPQPMLVLTKPVPNARKAVSNLSARRKSRSQQHPYQHLQICQPSLGIVSERQQQFPQSSLSIVPPSYTETYLQPPITTTTTDVGLVKDQQVPMSITPIYSMIPYAPAYPIQPTSCIGTQLPMKPHTAKRANTGTKPKRVTKARPKTQPKPKAKTKATTPGLTPRQRSASRAKSIISEYQTPRKRYKCEVCPEDFSRHTDMLRHMRTLHQSERPFACAYCGMSYARMDKLLVHRGRDRMCADSEFIKPLRARAQKKGVEKQV